MSALPTHAKQTEPSAATAGHRQGAIAAPAPVEQGGRVELRLEATAPLVQATYSARWFLGQGEAAAAPLVLLGVVTVDAGGQVQVAAHQGELPAWLADFTRALLRTVLRGAKDGAWPRRLTRWRDAPR